MFHRGESPTGCWLGGMGWGGVLVGVATVDAVCRVLSLARSLALLYPSSPRALGFFATNVTHPPVSYVSLHTYIHTVHYTCPIVGCKECEN